MSVKPFDAGGWFTISNWAFDVAMPQLSPNAWKVLCVAIRQTWGWADTDTDSGRKESDQISYSQFREKTGIASDATVRKALQECIGEGYILRRRVGTMTGTGAAIYAYALNRAFEAPATVSVEAPPATVSVAAPATVSVAAPATVSVETKANKANKQNAVAVVQTTDPEQQLILEALADLGVDPGTAQRLAEKCEHAQVDGWIAYAKEAPGLKNPPGFVVAKLRAGEDPPANGKRRDESDPRRFIEGKYADWIEY